MIWATVSSWSCFCWLYRASPSSAAKNIINLISGLTIWWWSMCRVFFYLVGRGCLLWPVCSFGKTVSLCPASFCTPRPNLPITLGISWLPPFAFQSPVMKRTSFFFLFFEEKKRLISKRLFNFMKYESSVYCQTYWIFMFSFLFTLLLRTKGHNTHASEDKNSR